MGRRTLLVCRGSHCRKKLARNGRVIRTLERLDVELETVGCQNVCRGPVIGARVAGDWEWFERVRSRKALGALEQ